jgi:hypothetical protein
LQLHKTLTSLHLETIVLTWCIGQLL